MGQSFVPQTEKDEQLLMTCKTQNELVKNEKEINSMETIAALAVAYVASLASDDDQLSANLLIKLIKAVIGEK